MSPLLRSLVFASAAGTVGGCLLSDLDPLQEGSAASSGAATTTTTTTSASASNGAAASTATVTGGTGGANGTGGTGGASGSGGSGGTGGCGEAIDLLADADNCGACGHSCLGGACADGACQPFVLASGLARPRYLVADDTHLFVSDDADAPDGGFFRISKGETEDVLRLATRTGGWALALRGDELLFTAVNEDDGIYATAKDGSGEERLVYETTLGIEIAVDPSEPTRLFVSEYTSGNPTNDDILLVDEESGDVSIVTDSAVCERMIYHDDRLYVGGATLRRVNPDGTGFATLTTRRSRRIAIDEDSVYLADYNTNELWAVDLVGTNERRIATGTAQIVEGDVAVDATHVYWSTTVGQSILRADKTGVDVAPELVAGGQAHANGILVDDDAIYWVTNDDGELNSGRIMKLAK